MAKRTEGDFFKLWARLKSDNSGGELGLLIVVVLYSASTIVSFFLTYYYLKHVHMNGRMLDAYRRVNSSAEHLFIPHDFEISEKELRAICTYSKRWRGGGKEHRVVEYCDYESVDPIVRQSTGEKTSHIAIYTCNPDDGSRSLWRQFLRTSDGACLEVFSEAPGTLQNDLNSALMYSQKKANETGLPDAGYFSGITNA